MRICRPCTKLINLTEHRVQSGAFCFEHIPTVEQSVETFSCILSCMDRTVTRNYLKRYGMYTVLLLAGPIFILTTNPHSLPLPLLVLPFMWLFAVLFVTSSLILKRRKDTAQRKVVIISGVIASIPVLLAIFQSIHQLSLKDVFLSLGLVLLAAWYVFRADFIR